MAAVTYKAQLRLTHQSGDVVLIEVSGKNEHHVAHITNSLRGTFKNAGVHDVGLTFADRSERRWYDFARDFFGLRRAR